jgi:hypothetical protein
MNTTLRRAIRACLATGSVVGAHYAMAQTNGVQYGPADIPTTNVLRFSGATAADTLARNVVASDFCADNDANTATASTLTSVFTTIAAEGSHTAVLCHGRTGGPVGTIDFAFIKESEAGSANGSVLVAQAATASLDFLDIFNGSFVCYGGTGTSDGTIDGDAGEWSAGAPNGPTMNLDVGGLVGTVRMFTNCTPQAQFAAQAGFSDVEQKLFGASGTATSDVLPELQVVFGTPVSLNLYRALQTAQGLNTGSCATTPDIPQCAPSLPYSLIGGILSGNITDWSQVQQNDGSVLTNVAGAPSDTQVYICRRGNSSGTQMETRAYFLHQGCGGSDTFATANNNTANGEADGNPYGSAVKIDLNKDGDTSDAGEGICDFSNVVVFAGDGSGDVRDCLDDRDDQDRWAIGVLSTDSAVDSTITLAAGGTTQVGHINGAGGGPKDQLSTSSAEAYTREFRFVRIDGYLPDLATIANGGYTFYAEDVAYARNSLTGVPQQIFRALFKDNTSIRRSANLVTFKVDDAFDNQPWGNGGYLAIPGLSGNAPATAGSGGFTNAQMKTTPVGTTTKSLTGSINNCSAPLSFQGGQGKAYLGPQP